MLKWQKVLLSVSLVIALIGWAMALTNPAPDRYEDFVLEQLKNRLQSECSRAGDGLLGALASATCRTMTVTSTPYFNQTVRPLVVSGTKRSDFLFFSIYVTKLSIPQLSFSTQVESIGAFNSFLVYRLP
jgi:Domain of unknown function (DUF4359)